MRVWDSRPAGFPLAPLRDVRDACRRLDDFVVHDCGHDGNGAFKHGVDTLRSPYLCECSSRTTWQSVEIIEQVIEQFLPEALWHRIGTSSVDGGAPSALSGCFWP